MRKIDANLKFKMERCWLAVRDSELSKYNSGYLVVTTDLEVRHYRDRREAERMYPSLVKNRNGDFLDVPLVYNVCDEVRKRVRELRPELKKIVRKEVYRALDDERKNFTVSGKTGKLLEEFAQFRDRLANFNRYSLEAAKRSTVVVGRKEKGPSFLQEYSPTIPGEIDQRDYADM